MNNTHRLLLCCCGQSWVLGVEVYVLASDALVQVQHVVNSGLKVGGGVVALADVAPVTGGVCMCCFMVVVCVCACVWGLGGEAAGWEVGVWERRPGRTDELTARVRPHGNHARQAGRRAAQAGSGRAAGGVGAAEGTPGVMPAGRQDAAGIQGAPKRQQGSAHSAVTSPSQAESRAWQPPDQQGGKGARTSPSTT